MPFSVSFSPQAGGRVDATSGFTSASGQTLNLKVHGCGATLGLLTVNPTSIDFGTVPEGTVTRNHDRQARPADTESAPGNYGPADDLAAKGTPDGYSTPL